MTAQRVKLRRDLRSLIYGAMTQSPCLREPAARQLERPFDAQTRRRGRFSSLERGVVLFFPNLVFALLTGKIVPGCRVSDGRAKNISLDHGRSSSSSLTGEKALPERHDRALWQPGRSADR